MPRISGDSLQDHRAQLQRRVFEAFAELMGEKSFDAITMAQIAARADLGRTAIYHHFPDKESVVVAYATHETEQYLADLREVLDASVDPAEQMRIYIRHHLDSGERFHMGLGPQLYGVLPASSRLAIREHVVAVEDVLRAILQGGIDAEAFVVDDIDATLALLHACLGPHHLPAVTIERFVLRALGAIER